MGALVYDVDIIPTRRLSTRGTKIVLKTVMVKVVLEAIETRLRHQLRTIVIAGAENSAGNNCFMNVLFVYG